MTALLDTHVLVWWLLRCNRRFQPGHRVCTSLLGT